MKRPNILVVGSLVMDLIVITTRFPKEGETVLGTDFHTASGGKGANQAVQAARLGANVTFVGKVGNDSFGKEMLDSVSSMGVDISKIMVDQEAPSSIGNVQIETADGKSVNRIIVVPGANMRIRPEDVAFLQDTLGNYDMVILQIEIPMEINELVATYAFEKNVPVMLNPAPSAPLSRELLSHVTYISPNEHEAADITGIAIHGLDSANECAKALMNMGAANALITLGGNGAVLGSKNEFLHSPCVPNVQVADPTAAGDSFVGTFCTGVCLGLSNIQALEFANCAAAITVSKIGAQPSLPAIGEVIALMQKMGCNITGLENLQKI